VAAPFDNAQLRFLRRFAEALFDGFVDMRIGIDQIVANFETQFALIGGKPLAQMRGNLDKLRLGLELFGWSLVGKAGRKTIVDRHLRQAKSDLTQDAARLKAIVYAAYYGHWLPGGEAGNETNPVHAQIGFTLPGFRNRSGPGEVRLERLADRDIRPEHVLGPGEVPAEVDIVVVGSGSGGAIAAKNLARPGRSVLVIEAGPFMPSATITTEERAMGARLFKHGTLQMTRDSDIVVFQGWNVGGSPTINNGICLRMHGDPLTNATSTNPFDTWRALDADIGYQALHESYDAVQGYLGIGQAEPRSGRGNGNHLLDGWAGFAAGRADPWISLARPGWFAKNFGPPGSATPCAYCGYCNTGCPYGRKVAMGQKVLPDACARGARILPDSKVAEIIWAPRVNGRPRRAAAVRVLVGPDRTPRTIKVRGGVVAAAGTIASSKLLARSDIAGTGGGISLNVASPVVALMPPGGSPAWDEDQMTTAVDCGDFWLESHFQPPQSMAMLLGGWFGEMDRRMKLYGRMRSAGVLIPIDRNGVLEDGKLAVKFSPTDVAVLRRALATLTRVHFANGAQEVWPSLRVGLGLRPGDDVDAFYARHVVEKDDVTLSSAHPHGGNPICADPDRGVVDLKCKVHGTDNVLVTDASVFPACIGVNAQFTVMAIAHLATRPDPVTGASPI
jgi:choline dehydrogenase-like flavoprotein